MAASPRTRRLVGLVALVAFALGGHWLRTRLGLHGSMTDLRALVSSLGWWGPALLLTVMTLRSFLALPSALVLTVGGLCFGIATATVVGTLGLVLSALLAFGLARAIGRDWIARHEGSRARRLEQRIDRLGPAVIGLSTAHPAGILTPLHWAAGLSSLPLRPFVVAIVLGSPVRAFAYACFGAVLAEPWSPAFVGTTAGLAVASLVPLAFPGVRRQIFASHVLPPPVDDSGAAPPPATG
jgi:uncharacterized membrane protein YdjX (TVP38/TMEM64 family)